MFKRNTRCVFILSCIAVLASSRFLRLHIKLHRSPCFQQIPVSFIQNKFQNFWHFFTFLVREKKNIFKISQFLIKNGITKKKKTSWNEVVVGMKLLLEGINSKRKLWVKSPIILLEQNQIFSRFCYSTSRSRSIQYESQRIFSIKSLKDKRGFYKLIVPYE